MSSKTGPESPYLGVQGLVDPLDQPGEHAFVQALGEGTDGIDHLLHVASLLHVLCPHTDPGLDQGLDQLHRVDPEEVGDLFGICRLITCMALLSVVLEIS